jgi:hypothetical protein
VHPNELTEKRECMSRAVWHLMWAQPRTKGRIERGGHKDTTAFIRQVSAQHAQLQAHSTVHNAAVAAGQLVHQPVRVVHVAHARQNLGVECPLRTGRVRRAEAAALRDRARGAHRVGLITNGCVPQQLATLRGGLWLRWERWRWERWRWRRRLPATPSDIAPLRAVVPPDLRRLCTRGGPKAPTLRWPEAPTEDALLYLHRVAVGFAQRILLCMLGERTEHRRVAAELCHVHARLRCLRIHHATIKANLRQDSASVRQSVSASGVSWETKEFQSLRYYYYSTLSSDDGASFSLSLSLVQYTPQETPLDSLPSAAR